MTDTTLNLTPEVYAYLKNNSLREPAILQELREVTQKMPMAIMQISAEQGQFMRLLVELMQAKRTLDIGTFTGYSALIVALGLPKDGKVIACDINGEWTDVAKQYWQAAGVADRIELRLAPALDTLKTLLKDQAGTFDFIFIDADKVNYPHYYELSLQLLRKGGLIAIDNVLYDGQVADPTNHNPNPVAIRALNQQLLHDERVSISLLPIGDGLTLALKRS